MFKTLHTDKDCKSIAVFRKSSPVAILYTNKIITGDWEYICPKCVSKKDYKAIEIIGERNFRGYNIKRELFNSLSNEYDMGSFDKFLIDIEDTWKRRKLYEEIKKEYGYSSFSAFSLYLQGYGVDPTYTEEEIEEYEPYPDEYLDYERDDDMRFGRTGH